jgi:hypothetical protein
MTLSSQEVMDGAYSASLSVVIFCCLLLTLGAAGARPLIEQPAINCGHEARCHLMFHKLFCTLSDFSAYTR